LLLTKLLEKVFLCGLTVADTKASGSITKCTDKEHLNGVTADLILEAMNKIKKADTENLAGLTDAFIEANGQTVYKMEKELTLHQVVKKK
jgi:hypothetical protein